MLHKLLSPLSPRWDITLLHFRKTGQRSATALMGLRVKEEEVPDFWRAVNDLGGEVGGWVDGSAGECTCGWHVWVNGWEGAL